MIISKVVFILIHLLLIALLLLGVNYDKEFNIKTTPHEFLYFIIAFSLNSWILYHFSNNIYTDIYICISLAILTVSAYTDKKTMYVYFVPTYVLFVMGILLESLAMGRFSYGICGVFLLPIFLGVVKAFGKGDISMCMVLGGIIYLQSQNIIVALFLECIMIILAEVFFIIKAIVEKNLKNPFQLKEKKPLGPSILLATYVMLFFSSRLNLGA